MRHNLMWRNMTGDEVGSRIIRFIWLQEDVNGIDFPIMEDDDDNSGKNETNDFSWNLIRHLIFRF